MVVRNVPILRSCSSTRYGGECTGIVGRTLEYRLTVDTPDIYREQVAAIEYAFPDVIVQCYQEEHWDAEE